ncbi:MAG: DUF4956 domain-containing protein [Bacteroidales bacterium]|nr:DUF4956 domain-containing protein [Bacteroidales bacterium]
MFDLSSLQYNSAYPGLYSIIITVLSSIVLGVILAFTYEKTSRNVERPDHFIQAMVLVTIVAATVLQAIGDSVARGLGMIGALSIIRFRTTVRNPRNIVFMFSAIAIGIATGVFGLLIALIGTLGFCLTAFMLYWSSFSPAKDFFGKLRIELDTSLVNINEVEKIMKQHCKKFVLKRHQVEIRKEKLKSSKIETETAETEKIQIQIKKLKTEVKDNFNFISYNYDFKIKKQLSSTTLADELLKLSGVSIKRISMHRNRSDNI